MLLRLSLPSPKTFQGHTKIKEPVQIEWDKAGVPVVQSADIQDAYFVQGVITARDRFFQMDLARRKMAGKLAELFGPKALASDLAARNWNYAQVAAVSFQKMDPQKREALISYANGVNAFLLNGQRPWEFWILGVKPEPWRPEDSFLVVLSMYESLNRHKESDEKAFSSLQKKLSPSVVSFLTPDWGFLDAPIVKDPSSFLPVPPPKEHEFRVEEKQAAGETSNDDFEPGSNAWVMSGKLTASGKPLLASDPHLDLRVPNLWYRLGIRTPAHFVYGVTIPGLPGVVIGRNTSVAWAFTNSAIDNVDQVVIPKKSPDLTEREEKIFIKGEKNPHMAHFKDSPWGPVVEEEPEHFIAVQWTALDPMNLKNLDLMAINHARDTSELLDALGKWAGPPQNAVFATKAGDIGWTIAGALPKRVGFDGKSRTIRSQKIHWDGYVPRSDFPVVVNPPQGFIVSANQRTVPVKGSLARFGSHWPNSARAKRIEKLLKDDQKWRPTDFLKVQTDNLSLTHLWYRDELLKCETTDESKEQSSWLKAAHTLIKEWDGKAEPTSAAYPLLKIFRIKLFNNLVGPIAQTISPSEKETLSKYLAQDTLLSQLLTARPKNFLSSDYSSYCDLLLKTLTESGRALASHPEKLAAVRWGDLNQSDIQHPFAKLLPTGLKPILSMPARPLPGDSLVPNVLMPQNGASMRLILDLADESRSLFSQPGGQSGHPLSEHFSDLFDAWVEGKAVPFELQMISFREKFTPKASDGQSN
ncbi:MAG: penicillin acylase family protein [Proteobacteria bacterium]|nr:penicillin acylase family protein [Pseudomonadota bacterium]